MKPGFIKNMGGRSFFCPVGDFHLDPKYPVRRAVISHAHADHAVKGHGEVYCTKGTMALMIERYGRNCAGAFVVKDYGEAFDIGHIRLCFFPAGHILGSAQVLLEFEGEKILYTGDFKVQHDESCEPFHFVQAHTLITESTFADPSHIHVQPEEELEKIAGISGNILIGAYSVGKAQRINKLLSQYHPGKKIMVHASIAKYHRVYESMGILPGKWEHYQRKLIRNSEGIIYLVPPQVYFRYRYNTSFVKAFATGWKNAYPGDFTLGISDHADWNDLLNVIETSGAEEIYTVHGTGTRLWEYYKNSSKRVVSL